MPHKVLVVDDSPASRSVLVAAIEGLVGIAVHTAAGGFEALKLLPKHQFALIITDIQMPDINGLELINFVKKNPNYKDTPLFVVTGPGREQDLDKGRALGASECLVKPFEPSFLEGLLRRYPKSPVSAASSAREEFLVEAAEVLEVLSRDLLRLDQELGKEPDPALLNGIFRAAHSLKGLASMLGQAELAELSHHTEDLLDRLRLGKVTLSGEVLEALGQSVDVLQAILLEAIQDKASPHTAGKASELGQRLSKLGNTQERSFDLLLEALELGPKVREVLTEYEEHRLRENLRVGRKVYALRMSLPVETFDGVLEELQSKLRALGEVVSVLPGANDNPERLNFELLFATQAEANLRKLVEGREIEVVQVSRRTRAPKRSRPMDLEITPTPGQALPLRAGTGAFLRPLGQTVRVEIGRLERLSQSVERLSEIQADLRRLSESAISGKPAVSVRRLGNELTRYSHRLDQTLLELRQRILEARRVPLGPLFEKLSRAMRKLLAEGKKEIYLQISGAEVELDKLAVDQLSDSLMHLIRNAVAHGIERPSERKAKGKSRRGKISISARAVAGEVQIEVRDDGAGIDPLRVREEASLRGVLTPIEALAMPDTELLRLLFLPGFSTARAVSSLSGRGVGLDAVKHTVEGLGGHIDVVSSKDVGTAFTLTIPVLVHEIPPPGSE